MDHAVPVLFTERRKGTIPCDPGVTDHAIPGAVHFHILLQHLAALGAVTHVKREQTPVAARLFDGVQGVLCPCGVAVVVHPERKSVSGQFKGDGPANAFAGAGDQNGTTH